MNIKQCLRFASIIILLACAQMSVAIPLTATAEVADQKPAKQKKAHKKEKGFWCVFSDITWTVDAESELMLEPNITDAVLGQAIRKVYPGYPSAARAARAQGNVLVEAVISKTGEVASIKSVAGDPSLIQASTESAKGWRFTPTTVKGEAVEALAKITFKYDLGIGKEQTQGKTKEKKKQR